MHSHAERGNENKNSTRSVEAGIPTQSVGTRTNFVVSGMERSGFPETKIRRAACFLVPTLCVGNAVTERSGDHACFDAERRIIYLSSTLYFPKTNDKLTQSLLAAKFLLANQVPEGVKHPIIFEAFHQALNCQK